MSSAFLDPLVPSIAAALAFPVVAGIVKKIVDLFRRSGRDVTIDVMGQKMSVQVGRDASREELNKKVMEKVKKRHSGAT